MTARIVDACFSVLFIGLAVAVGVSADPLMGLGPSGVAAILAVLGVEGLYSAIVDRRSWLSRIGPLP